MANRYSAISSTYLRRPTLSQGTLSAAGVILIALTFVAANTKSSRAWIELALPIGTPMAAWFVGLGLWQRLREQLTTERRRLFPSYVGPQLIVFSGLWIALTCLWPGLLAISAQMNILGLIGYVTAICAVCGLWVTVSPRLRILLGFSAAGWIPLLSEETSPLHKMLQGRNDLLSLSILCLALAAATTSVIQMLNATEDDVAQSNSPSTLAQAIERGLTPLISPRNSSDARLMLPARFPSFKLSKLAPVSGGGIIARSRRWRATIRHYPSVFIGMLPFALAFQYLIFSRTGVVPQARMLFPTAIFLLMPIQMVLATWARAWKYVEADCLRPIGRREFIQAIGAAIIIQMSQQWSCAAAVFTLGGMLLHIPLLVIANLLLASLAFLIMMFSITVFALRYQPRRLDYTLSMSANMPIIAIIGIGRSHDWTASGAPLIASLAIALTGIALIRFAYHLWLKTEVD